MTTEKKEEKKSFDEMWADVKKNSGDFNAWTSLLTHVEQNVLLIGIQSARDVFLSFFEHYPYCYGYWKKLADLERKNVQEGEELAMEKCQEIFEKGLQAIPLSVDLWLQYINFLKTKLKDREDEVEQLRALYKRAVDVAGLEFRSDRLWDSWIAWETEQQQLVNVTAIYDKLISTPTQLYSQHFEKFQGLLEKYPLTETLGEVEIEEWKQLYEQRKGEGATDEDEATFIKGEAIQRRKDIYKKNEEACTTRWTFEEGVKSEVHLKIRNAYDGDVTIQFSSHWLSRLSIESREFKIPASVEEVRLITINRGDGGSFRPNFILKASSEKNDLNFSLQVHLTVEESESYRPLPPRAGRRRLGGQ